MLQKLTDRKFFTNLVSVYMVRGS